MDNLIRELREAGEWAMPKPDLNRLLHRAANEIERLNGECIASMTEIANLRTDLDRALKS